MASDKQTNLAYIIILLLFANTLFLGGIFFSLCTGSLCGLSAKKGYMCPWSKGSKGSMQGSPKGSM